MKIAVIGNAGGGKTTFSLKLSKKLNCPVYHVDSYQFLPGMKLRPFQETIPLIKKIHEQSAWIIDGYGPLDLLFERLALADHIVMIDLPIWTHFFWGLKRQIKSLWWTRPELPQDCREATLDQTIKLFKTIWKVHTQMRPELLRILNREKFHGKVKWIKAVNDFDQDII